MPNMSQSTMGPTKPKFAIQIENGKMIMNDGGIGNKLQKTKYTPNLYSPTLAKTKTTAPIWTQKKPMSVEPTKPVAPVVPAWTEKKPMSVAPVKEPVVPAWVQKAPMSVAPVKTEPEEIKPQADFLNELDYDIKNGATVQEIIKAYPELKNNTKLINELHYDVSNGATIDEIKQAYPELGMQDINKLSLGEELVARAKNIGGDIADRFGDIKESFTREKSDNPIISSAQGIGTGLKTAGSIIGAGFDVVGEGIGLVTPDFIKNALTGTAKSVWNKTPDVVKEKTVSAIQQGGEAYSKFKKENPYLADALEGSGNIASLLPTGKIGKTLAPAFKTTGKTIAKGGGKLAEGGTLLKSKIITPKNLEKEVGKVIQGETKNIKPAIETLKIVDTKGVKTYNDLLGKVGEKQKNIVALQDNLLQKETGTYGLKNTNKQIQTALGEKQINYVKNSLDDIKREIETVGDFESYNKKLLGKDKTLGETIKRIEDGDASLEDLNDIARYYNSEFRDKIYTKQGIPKNSEIAGKYETNRKGIKEFVREQLSTKELKDLDLQYSNIAETKKLISKINEGVNKLEQKFKDRGIGYKIVSGTLKVADTVSLGGVRALKNYFITSNIGSKINNLMDIQNDLSKNLKTINNLLNKKDLNKKDLLNLNNNLPKNANITNSNLLNTIKNSETTKGYLGGNKEIKPSILSPREQAKIKAVNKPTKPYSNKSGFTSPKEIKKSIVGDDLISEAKKYKSADEFVKGLENKGEIVYHGTNTKIDKFDNAFIGKGMDDTNQTGGGMLGKGIYLTSNKNLANKFGDELVKYKGGNTNTIKAIIDGKLLNNIPDDFVTQFIKNNPNSFYKKSLLELNPEQRMKMFIGQDEVINALQKYAKSKGFIGLERIEKNGYVEKLIFDAKNIKTEAQLKKIYNTLNKKG